MVLIQVIILLCSIENSHDTLAIVQRLPVMYNCYELFVYKSNLYL
jgi:hypothetical protein